jgi:hypothetical protein
MARPVAVVMSSASVSETKPTPRAATSCSMATKSGKDRPHRSKRHTSTASISPRQAASISVSRSSRSAAPEPTSFTSSANRRAATRRILAHRSHRKRLTNLTNPGSRCPRPTSSLACGPPQHFRRAVSSTARGDRRDRVLRQVGRQPPPSHSRNPAQLRPSVQRLSERLAGALFGSTIGQCSRHSLMNLLDPQSINSYLCTSAAEKLPPLLRLRHESPPVSAGTAVAVRATGDNPVCVFDIS